MFLNLELLPDCMHACSVTSLLFNSFFFFFFLVVFAIHWHESAICSTLLDRIDHSLTGSSVHGIFLARILEWVARPSSRGTSGPRKHTSVSCISRQFITTELAIQETLLKIIFASLYQILLGLYHYLKISFSFREIIEKIWYFT